MVASRQTGYSKNHANFNALIGFCKEYGTIYNPSSDYLKITSLESLLQLSKEALNAYSSAKINLDYATNAREVAFEPIKRLSTRVLNTIVASVTIQQTIDDVRSVNLKIHGRRAKAIVDKKPEEGIVEKEIKFHSIAQLGYDTLLSNFERLVQTVSAESLYKPNENELQLVNLELLLADLQTKNNAVIQATAAASNAKIIRDELFTKDNKGLHFVSLGIKAYVKALFGASSTQYTEISKIRVIKI